MNDDISAFLWDNNFFNSMTEIYDSAPTFFSISIFLLTSFLIINFISVLVVINKSGWNPLWVLVLAVPFVNIIFYYIFCFATWPVHQKIKSLQQQKMYLERELSIYERTAYLYNIQTEDIDINEEEEDKEEKQSRKR